MFHKFGRQPAVVDPRVPALHHLMAPVPPPAASNWYAAVGDWPMLKNDVLGDCVPAGALHCVQQRMKYAGKPVTFADQDADNLYRAWAGYDGTPATDNGTVMSDAMAKWAADGIPLPGGGVDKLTAYATVDHTNPLMMRRAISACGGILIGINLPAAWEQLDPGDTWDIPDGNVGPIVGGHCVYLPGYLPTALGTEYPAVTWGARYANITERALLAVIEEAYAILDPDWNNADGINPASIDWAAATAAMVPITVG